MSDDPKEPVFFLTGGPGQSNMEFEFANRYVGDRDFVLVGYRGIDGSVRLDCPEVESALKHSTDVLSEEFFRAYGDGYRYCADRLIGEGVDPASYGLVQQVDERHCSTLWSPATPSTGSCPPADDGATTIRRDASATGPPHRTRAAGPAPSCAGPIERRNRRPAVHR